MLSLRFRAAIVVCSLCAWVVTGCSVPLRMSIGSALQEARRSNRIVLVEFWSVASPECLRMDAEVLTDPFVREDLKDFVRVRVDYLLNRKVAEVCGVTGVPGFAALRPDGTLIVSQTGPLDKDQMRRFLLRAKIFR